MKPFLIAIALLVGVSAMAAPPKRGVEHAIRISDDLQTVSIYRFKCPRTPASTCKTTECWVVQQAGVEKLAEITKGGGLQFQPGVLYEQVMNAMLEAKVPGFNGCSGVWE